MGFLIRDGTAEDGVRQAVRQTVGYRTATPATVAQSGVRALQSTSCTMTPLGSRTWKARSPHSHIALANLYTRSNVAMDIESQGFSAVCDFELAGGEASRS